jgi:hypothetical protein
MLITSYIQGIAYGLPSRKNAGLALVRFPQKTAHLDYGLTLPVNSNDFRA